MNKQVDARYKKADVEPNKVYKQLISILIKVKKLLLIKLKGSG
jgi:hypothetical protein